jgi:hypothetical protein
MSECAWLVDSFYMDWLENTGVHPTLERIKRLITPRSSVRDKISADRSRGRDISVLRECVYACMLTIHRYMSNGASSESDYQTKETDTQDMLSRNTTHGGYEMPIIIDVCITFSHQN